ncbi:hypothetical protein LBMAG53_10300 [Planctomycetota bacterium]|nr:hypothetical protein LBMAG53_10300 [Planctomycetota bacterium]
MRPLLPLFALLACANAADFREDFSAATAVPASLLVLNGDFALGDDAGNAALRLAPAPLDTSTLLFGPVGATTAKLRAKGLAKGRQAPAFGVGLGGVSGVVLRLSANKQALELVRDDAVLVSITATWTSGAWTWLAIRQRADGGNWIVEGKGWTDGTPEPTAWAISQRLDQALPKGRPSVWGIPYGGQPLWFDDLIAGE